uniref:CCHC-type domain-containing protein n=1 Tax=Tanacetum cinerariifolium TaxID=118510 RepID=A0A6L2JXW9_TANCI|nr:hypothetical protein [Tanacetum cinerariifolium]
MHNNIMAAGLRDRPPMLAMKRYTQWQSRFLRYIDTRPNGDALRKCILEAHYESEKEAIHLLLTGIGDEIYSTVDACKTGHEMWIAIERLQPGKEIAKPITPPSESASKEDSDPEQAQRDKDMQKNLALVAKYFIKIYKPTKNNLGTSSNSRNKNVDTTPWYKNENQTRQFGNQRTATVARARKTVGGQVVQQNGIQCFNCKEFGHFAKEYRKPKRVKDSTYHKEKMLLCKQAEKDSGTNTEPLEQVHNDAEYNVFATVRHHMEQPESTSNTCLVENDDSNVTPDSPDMCDNDIQTDQNAKDERDVLANLIANLKLDVDENKKIQKLLKKANASLAHELKECKSILAKTSRTLGESNSILDSCLIALQNKQIEFERYKAVNDRTVNYDKLKLVKEKHDELVKQNLLTKSHYEGLVKEKTKVITDLKLKEERDIDKMITIEKQLMFLNEIVYKRNQSIQTIHMLAPKGPTFNGRPTFANLMYLKMAQSKKPCLYEILNDQFDPTNRLIPDREETLTLEKESRSKLNKDLLAHANEVRKKIWRKSFVKFKPNIFKNIGFLHVSKSISKSRQAYNVTTNNINHFRELVDQAWEKHSHNHFRAPAALDMEMLIRTCLMPLAIKTQNDSFTFVHELKQKMHADLKYVESIKNEIDELKSDKAEFPNMYDILLKECECLAQKLSKQTESVSKEVYTELLRSFAKLEKHSISLELALQQCQEHIKNHTVCKEKASNVFQKEREQCFKIQDLKAQLQDKNIAISELKKLIEKCKGKSVETKFDKPSVVRQPNAQRIPK